MVAAVAALKHLMGGAERKDEEEENRRMFVIDKIADILLSFKAAIVI